MDQAVRNKLRNVVTQCRKLLEESISQQLQGQFGIYAGKKDAVQVEDAARMGHLSEEDRQYRRDLLDHFEHIKARGFKPREALDQLVREIAFTHLNRLCAYKMMEARDVYVGGQKFREAVSRGIDSNGFKFYLADHPEEERLFKTGEQELAYRHFLDWLGGLLSEEIGVLFNPNDPANRLCPRQKTLDDLLDLLNGADIKPEETELRDAWPKIWEQDETIGWVYQYFTPKELRDKARKESQAPRNSYELAFRNQFFTPRYVVEFLTDNTLGRIWYEMRQGSTKLKDQCRYMVRRPDEVFLSQMAAEGQEHPAEGCVAVAKLLQEGDEANFPPFAADNEDGVQRMIDLAHCVNGYVRHPADGERTWPWMEQNQATLQRPESLADVSTQDLLDLSFLVCRADRHGGDGSVYSEPWFANVANEVRSRAISARSEDATQEQLLKAPQFIPYRPKKDPRELKILDPACGSGHFLLYCFDLLLTIYEEAYEDEDLGPALKEAYPTLDELRRAVPGLIVSRNLHGIDIDLRATQIAALALWLRSQRAYQEMGIKKNRPKITRSNIVCAEPMPGEEGLLDEFLKTLREDRLEQLIRRVMHVPADKPVRATEEMADRLCELVRLVWEKMKLAGEAGSLLQIEEELQGAIRMGQEEWEEKQPLFRISQYSLTEEPQEKYVRFVPKEGLSFWERAEALVMAALEDFAAYAANGQELLRKLFANDAMRGFAFIDLCRQRFDVVVMNPPFGDSSERVAQLLNTALPVAKKNTYIASVVLGVNRLAPQGMLGAITDATFIHQTRYEDFRHFLLERPSLGLMCLVALGWEVLDSYVETACYVISTRPSASTLFVDMREHGNQRSTQLRSVTDAIRTSVATDGYSFFPAGVFAALPKSVLAFWLPVQILKAYRNRPSLDPAHVDARCGLSSSDNFRFYKLRWEVPPDNIARSKRWSYLSNGGHPSPLFRQHCYVVDFQNDGAVIRARVKELFGSETRTVINQQYYYRAGLTYGKRTESITFQFMPHDFVFSNEGQAVFPNSTEGTWGILGYLNTSMVAWLLNSIAGQHKEAGYVGSIPSPPENFLKNHTIREYTQGNYRLLASISQAIPESQYFVSPFAPGGLSQTTKLRHLADRLVADDERFAQRFNGIDAVLEAEVGFSSDDLRPWTRRSWRIAPVLFEADNDELTRIVAHDVVGYLIGSLFGRWDIRYAMGEQETPGLPDPLERLCPCLPGMLQGADGLPAKPVEAPLDYPIQVDWDGIMVDDAEHKDDIVRRLRELLELLWHDSSETVEKEACEIFGTRNLREYLRKPGKGCFWDDHVKRYSKSRRKAPIYWLLQSSKKNYALWLYYHRLDKDMLFKALVNYVEPKIQREENRLAELRSQKSSAGESGKGAKKLDRDIEKQEDLLSELRDFAEKLRKVADLHLVPDLNDGVVLNIAPLWELVPWKEAKKYWEELLDGKYEWSSIGKQLREKNLAR